MNCSIVSDHTYSSTLERITSTHFETERFYIVMAPLIGPIEGDNTLSVVRCSFVVQRFTPQYIWHPPPGVFVSYFSGKKFDLLQVMQEENVPGGVMTSQPSSYFTFIICCTITGQFVLPQSGG